MEFHSPPLYCGGGVAKRQIYWNLGTRNQNHPLRLSATFGISPVDLPLFVFSVIDSYLRRLLLLYKMCALTFKATQLNTARGKRENVSFCLQSDLPDGHFFSAQMHCFAHFSIYACIEQTDLWNGPLLASFSICWKVIQPSHYSRTNRDVKRCISFPWTTGHCDRLIDTRSPCAWLSRPSSPLHVCLWAR